MRFAFYILILGVVEVGYGSPRAIDGKHERNERKRFSFLTISFKKTSPLQNIKP